MTNPNQPPPIIPGSPEWGAPPVPVLPPKAKKTRPAVIVIGVTAGVLALCCGIGVIAAATSGQDPKPTNTHPVVAGVENAAASAGKAAPPPAPVKTTPALPPGTVTDTGTLLVGTDIVAGTYRGLGCRYWARLKNANGDLDSILANGNVGSEELLTVTILGSDYAFQNSCGSLQPIASVPTVASSNSSSVFGTLAVGKDIQPGTWWGTATGHCYWARLSGFTGGLDDVLANDNVSGGEKFTVTVKASDKGLEVGSDCGPLTKLS
jgi:hypothetical protein